MAKSIEIRHRHAIPERPRLDLLDAARGAALAAMFVYHFTWDLDFFGFIDPQVTRSTAFAIVSHLIASAFLFISGVALFLAHRLRFRLDAFSKHFGKIALAAALVTIATAQVMPQGVVTFGILHCLAAGALAAALFLRSPAPLTLLASSAMILAPLVWTSPAMDSPALQWLGLGTREPFTFDWRPFLPWAGLVVAGLGMAQLLAGGPVEERLAVWRAQGPAGRGLILMGRWSLPIYLIHQPVLLALLWLAAAGLAPAQGDAESRAFLSSCAAQCRASGVEPASCQRNCACLMDGLKSEGLWHKSLASGFDEAGQAAARRIGEACARR